MFEENYGTPRRLKQWKGGAVETTVKNTN